MFYDAALFWLFFFFTLFLFPFSGDSVLLSPGVRTCTLFISFLFSFSFSAGRFFTVPYKYRCGFSPFFFCGD